MKRIFFKGVTPIWSVCCLLSLQPAIAQKAASSHDSASPEAVVEVVGDFQLTAKLEGLTNHVYGLAFSPDGKRVAAGDTDGFARVWSFPEGKSLASFSAALEEDEDVSLFHATTFNRDGTLLFAGDDLGRVHVWEISSGKTRKVIRAHGKEGAAKYRLSIDDMALSPDGNQLVTCGADGQVRLWSVPGGEPVKTILKHRRAIEGVVFSPDGGSVLAIDIDGRLQEVSVKDGKTVAKRNPRKDDSMPGGLTIDRTGKVIVSQSYRGPARVLDRPGLKEVRAMGPPKAQEEDVGFRGNDLDLHPSGRVLAVAYRHSHAEHGLVVLWDIETGKELKRFEIFYAVADNVRFSPDGRHLVAAGAETWVAVFGLKPQ